jgi:ABC-type branched-subunit amino acid transport system ATPase component
VSDAAPDPLAVQSVSVRFGGLRALDDVSLRVPEGSIVGLIGPNGAGKTTLFNCVTGMVRVAGGTVTLFGQNVRGWSVHRRARLGLARTFQRLELFGTLTVLENLVVAHEAHTRRGGLFSDMLALPSSVEGRAAAEARGRDVLELVGLSEFADTRAGDLPAGLARLTELARALCTEPRLLLLDEPSAGLRATESRRLATVLAHIRDATAMSVLVVEHNMEFVLGLVDHVSVLDFGRLLAEGTPAEIRKDPVVQAAYLGEEIDDAAAARR